MKHYITVDGGTTNTRVTLVRDLQPIDTVRIPLGARAGIDDKNALPNALKEAISTLLQRHALQECDVPRVIASGMITSEFGLCNLPHVSAPAGIAELHHAMHTTYFPQITPLPFVFIRGVKITGETLADTDMMRGEETELIGLTDLPQKDALYILPGSHSKWIQTDEKGRISHFQTMLTGEMIAALSSGTILKDAVDLSVDTLVRSSLLDGFHYTQAHGINAALFKVRILKNLLSASPAEVYSFFLGATLAPEIQEILKSPAPHVIIGGKAQIKRATEMLLRALSNKSVTAASDASVDASSARGAVKIYEYQE